MDTVKRALLKDCKKLCKELDLEFEVEIGEDFMMYHARGYDGDLAIGMSSLYIADVKRYLSELKIIRSEVGR